MPMTGFKPLTSGVRSDRSTNWVTTTALTRSPYLFRLRPAIFWLCFHFASFVIYGSRPSCCTSLPRLYVHIFGFFNGPSRPLFSLFSSYQYSWQYTNVKYKFPNDWIRTSDLWYFKRPLYQLGHHHCPCSYLCYILYVFSFFFKSTGLYFCNL